MVVTLNQRTKEAYKFHMNFVLALSYIFIPLWTHFFTNVNIVIPIPFKNHSKIKSQGCPLFFFLRNSYNNYKIFPCIEMYLLKSLKSYSSITNLNTGVNFENLSNSTFYICIWSPSWSYEYIYRPFSLKIETFFFEKLRCFGGWRNRDFLSFFLTGVAFSYVQKWMIKDARAALTSPWTFG